MEGAGDQHHSGSQAVSTLTQQGFDRLCGICADMDADRPSSTAVAAESLFKTVQAQRCHAAMR